MAAAPAVPQVGGRLGPYELLSPLGVGGMSEVYRARDTRLGREVAIKFLDFETARHPERLRLFEHEARAAGAIEHPAIVAVHDVGHEGDVPYVVLELVEGETLQRRLLRGRLPVRKALETAIQIGHGLAAAHARGILHNDIKPSNVILTRDGRVKILDFGLAGLRGGRAAQGPAATSACETITQSLFGTPGYVAPERIDGHVPDARSDVFSLGAVLYEMLAGVPAFDGATTAEVLTATSERDPPEIDPPLSPALARVVHRALEKDPGPALPVRERPRVRARGARHRHGRPGDVRAPPGATVAAVPGLRCSSRSRSAGSASPPGGCCGTVRCPTSSG